MAHDNGQNNGHDQRITTLLMSDLVNSTQWVRKLGDRKAALLAQRHDDVARSLMAAHQGLELEKTDGFLLLFNRPIHAVAYAIAYHQALYDISAEFDMELRSRVGIRTCELPDYDSNEANRHQVDRKLKGQTDELMSLSAPNQTLVTQSVLELSLASKNWDSNWKWVQHGIRTVTGWPCPIALSEIGLPGKAPFSVPGLAESTQWQPAEHQPMKNHDHWVLEKNLSKGAASLQRWIATHHKTQEKRLFIFSMDQSELTEMRRIVAIGRLLKMEFEGLKGVAPILDWNLDNSPFLIQYGIPEQGNLNEWIKARGGLEAIPLSTRINLVAQLAETLHRAHSIGILHKHINPDCIWIDAPQSAPSLSHSGNEATVKERVLLTDFDTTSLQSEEMLQKSGITTRGLDLRQLGDLNAPPLDVDMYLAPERLAGKPATIQGDIYALGVLLYQLVTGSFDQTAGHGWDQEIDDSFLRSVIARSIEGRPEKRLSRASELADLLRQDPSKPEPEPSSKNPKTKKISSGNTQSEDKIPFLSFRSPWVGYGLAGLFAILLLLHWTGVLP